MVTISESCISSFYPTFGTLAAGPIAVILIAAWLASRVARILVATWQRRWEQTRQLFIAVGFATFLSFLMIWGAIGDEIHLATMYPSYEMQIAALHGQPMIFSWGTVDFGAFAPPPDEHFLLYDPSGKCAYPNSGEVVNYMTHFTKRFCTGWREL